MARYLRQNTATTILIGQLFAFADSKTLLFDDLEGNANFDPTKLVCTLTQGDTQSVITLGKSGTDHDMNLVDGGLATLELTAADTAVRGDMTIAFENATEGEEVIFPCTFNFTITAIPINSRAPGVLEQNTASTITIGQLFDWADSKTLLSDALGGNENFDQSVIDKIVCTLSKGTAQSTLTLSKTGGINDMNLVAGGMATLELTAANKDTLDDLIITFTNAAVGQEVIFPCAFEFTVIAPPAAVPAGPQIPAAEPDMADSYIKLDGSSGYVDTGQTFQAVFRDSFWVNIWCNPVLGSPMPLNICGIVGHPAGGDRFQFDIWSLFNVEVVMSIGEVVATLVSHETIPPLQTGDNDWMMITVVVRQVDATYCAGDLYTNGVYVATLTTELVLSQFSNTNRNLQIGYLHNINYSVDGFRIYSGLPAEGVIAALFANGRMSEYPDGVATAAFALNFDEGSGTTVTDAVGGVLQGTLVGGITWQPLQRVYKGQDGIINYSEVVATMNGNAPAITIPDQALPVNTIWHYVRRNVSECGLESADSPPCIVQIDSSGEMLGNTPNAPASLTIDGLAGGLIKLKWRYTRIDEEVAPSGFKVYMDSGSGFDFDSPEESIPYGLGGSGEFNWTSEALYNGQVYRFIVRSYRTGAGQSQNTNFVAARADSQGPAAITNLFASYQVI